MRSGRVPNLQYASDWEPFIERGYEVLEEARRFQNYFESSIGNSDEEFVPENLRERNIQTSIEYEAVTLKFFSDIWRLKESYRDNLLKGLLSEEGLEEYENVLNVFHDFGNMLGDVLLDSEAENAIDNYIGEEDAHTRQLRSSLGDDFDLVINAGEDYFNTAF